MPEWELHPYKGCAISDTPTRLPTDADAPLQDFSKCHVGFVTVLGEEEEFLPFAQQVLARQAEDMATLGLALHLRHEAEEIMATAVVYGAT